MKRNNVLYIISTFILIVLIYNHFRPFDNTDDSMTKTRSGLMLYTDYGTGCQYITAGILAPFISPLTPRTDKKGNHAGCYEN